MRSTDTPAAWRAPRTLGVTAMVAAAVVLSACGSSSKALSSSASPAASRPATSAAPAAGSTVGSSAPAAALPSLTVSGGSDPDSRFCQLAKAQEQDSSQLGTQLSNSDPATVKAFIQKEQSELAAFVAAAPSQIKSAVNDLAGIDNQLFTTLKNDGYVFATAEPAIEKIASDPALSADTQKLGTYLESGCGFKVASPSATPTT